MTITDQQVEILRAILADDTASMERWEQQTRGDCGEAFPVLVALMFILAARWRFPGDWSAADVIRYVGQVRVRSEDYDGISPSIAEQLLLAALRDTSISGDAEEMAKGRAEFMLLADLVSGLDRDEQEALLAEARERADARLAGRACG